MLNITHSPSVEYYHLRSTRELEQTDVSRYYIPRVIEKLDPIITTSHNEKG